MRRTWHRIRPVQSTWQGYFTGTVAHDTSFAEGDVRATIPRFEATNRDADMVLLDHVTRLAAAIGATPGQVALAWLLAQQPWIAPIPGTRRPERLAENIITASVALSADDIADMKALAARVGAVFVMSASFTNQVLAQLELWTRPGQYGPGVHLLPKHLDAGVARLHLDALRVRLTELTKAEAANLGVDVAGPYRMDHYRC
jgi:hypothetical protein